MNKNIFPLVASSIIGVSIAFLLSPVMKVLSIPLAFGYYFLFSKRFPRTSTLEGPFLRVGDFFATALFIESPSRVSRDSISLLISSIRSLFGKTLKFLVILAFNSGIHCNTLFLVITKEKVEPSLLLPIARMRIGKVSVPSDTVLKSLLPCSCDSLVIPPANADPQLIESVLTILPSGWVLCISVDAGGRASVVIGTNKDRHGINVPEGFRVERCREIPGDGIDMAHKFSGEDMMTMGISLGLSDEEKVIIEEIITGDWKERARGLLMSIPGSIDGKPIYVRGEEVIPTVVGRDFVGLVSDDLNWIVSALPLCIEYAVLSGRGRVIVVCEERVKGTLSKIVGSEEGAVIRIYGSEELEKLREYLTEKV